MEIFQDWTLDAGYISARSDQFFVAVEQLDLVQQEELYGLGTTATTTNTTNRVDNIQSSIADLRILHQRELELIRVLQGSKEAGLTVEAALAEDGFTLDSVLHSDVLHPVDSYNLSFSSPPPGRGDWASWAWA